MNREEHKKFSVWRRKIIDTKNISPIELGMSQDDVISIFGKPDDTSTAVKNERPLIFKYQDIEFHFDERYGHTLFLIYSDYKTNISITAEKNEQTQLSKNIFSKKMGQMLKTPFGYIEIYINGNKINYNAQELEKQYIDISGYIVFAVDGRHKISISLKHLQTPISIECKFGDDINFIESGIESGQRLALKSWYIGSKKMSIGTDDEVDWLDVQYLDRGIQVNVVKSATIDEVIFGIAWIELKNSEIEDVYTWFAADPPRLK